MNLQEALARFSDWKPKQLEFPKTTKTAHAADDVAKRLSDVSATINMIDLEDLERRLIQACAKKDWSEISTRDWRYVAVCLNAGTPPLIEDMGFVDQYLSQLEVQGSRNAVSRLILCYFTHFDMNRVGIRKIAAYLQKAVTQRQWLWSDEKVAFLFDVSNAPQQLAKYIRQSKDNPPEAVKAIGLGPSLYSCGLAGHAYIAAADEFEYFAKHPHNHPSLLQYAQRFANWGLIDKEFAFGGTHHALERMTEAMLTPWIHHQPPEDVKSFIEGHLLSLLGDPRIDLHKKWLNVNESAKQVMRRWLTKASLEQFLDVVSCITKKPHMWPARRKFWSAYYEKGYMLEAWVAFAKEGATLAIKLASREKNPDIRNFSTLSGAQKDHAVLIMRIGNLTIADWNRDGACRIWNSDNRSAPKLYRRAYDREDLITGSDHDRVHNGAWQMDIHDHIQHNTGIRISRWEYM